MISKEDMEEVKSLLNLNKEAPQVDAQPYDPIQQVQDALATFLQARLRKLEQDQAFEDQIKRMISAKMPEATFAELLRLLDVFQANNNTGVEKVLSPFIPRAGDRVPLLEEKKKKTDADAGTVSKEMSQDMLQAFQELSKLMDKMRTGTPSNAADIKAALGASTVLPE